MWNFTTWYGFEEEFCRGKDIGCQLALNPNLEVKSIGDVVGLNIISTRGPTFESNCNCSSLIDYVRWHYSSVQNYSSSLTFLNDSKIVIAGKPAWNIEYNSYWLGEPQHHFEFLTISNNTYNQIDYYADPDSFDKFLPIAKQMISSLLFIPVREITDAEIPPYVQDFSPKKPSFMQD